MSLFNKPKRNIRRRHILDEEEDNENGSSQTDDHVNVKTKVKKDKPKQTIVSFGAEMEEGDDGEVFKVKKSSRSRRLKKQLDQERRKKKDERFQTENDFPSTSHSQDKDVEIKTDDLVVKIKNSGPLIINDQDGFLTAMDDDHNSVHEEDNKNYKRHEFRKKSERTESMPFFLQSGCIPDAATIHAARKRRQKVRESANNDYIPVEEQNMEADPRLIGRVENQSDEEDFPEVLSMNVNTVELDKEKRRQAFLESQESKVRDSDEESEHELEDWETQQIRKVVTGASLGKQTNKVVTSNKTQIVSPPSPPNPSKCVLVSTDQILNRIRERLNTLNELYRRYELNYQAVEEELTQSKAEIKENEVRAAELAEQYKHYQELRLVRNSVDCEKL